MTRVTLRLPEETYSRLKARQRITGQSMNELIVRAVDKILGEESNDVADERHRIKAALGDLVMEIDPSLWPTFGRPEAERKKNLATLPKLERPLSRDIIEDRGDR